MYSFKQNFKIPSLINIYRNGKCPQLEICTKLSSDIFINNQNHTVVIDINHDLNMLLNILKNESETFLIEKNLIKKKQFKSSDVLPDTLCVKLPRKYDRYTVEFYNHDNTRTISSDFKKNSKVKMNIILEFIWLSEHYWGFTWKATNMYLV